jgi:hypothetical protein
LTLSGIGFFFFGMHLTSYENMIILKPSITISLRNFCIRCKGFPIISQRDMKTLKYKKQESTRMDSCFL